MVLYCKIVDCYKINFRPWKIWALNEMGILQNNIVFDSAILCGSIKITYMLLPPFQIISHSNFLKESNHVKFDQINIIR